MSNQSLRQASVRAVTGTTYDYNGDWSALFTLAGISESLSWNGRLLTWINAQLGTSYTDVPGAMQAFAVANGAYNWDSLTTINTAASTIIAAMVPTPSAARQALINSLVSALQAAGVWTKLDILYVMAAASAQAAGLNWKSPSTFALTAVNSPTFTADQGYAGDGATSYVDTGWDAATNGSQYAQNSATIGAWSRTAAQANGFLVGTGTALAIALRPRSTADAFRYYINAATLTDVASTDGSGLFAASRSGAHATQSYRNGSALGSGGVAASGALSSVDINIGRCNSTFSAYQTSASFAGANLSGGEHAALYNALNTYMVAVGAA